VPIPRPKIKEKKDDFLKRCMSDKIMLKEYPKKDQRYAICNQRWNDKEKSERQKIKVWSKESAASWLKKHDFKTGNYEKLANYHSFRQTDPKKYKEFKLDKSPFDFKESDGVVIVYGIYQKEGKRTAEIQSIRFYHGEKEKEEKKSMNNRIEYRSYPIELRIDSDDIEKPKITGYAALFNEPSEPLGGFREIIKKGAFKDSILEDDIVATRNHDKNMLLGRNKSGTLILKEDKRGLYFVIEPPDTTYAKDLAVSMERGDINQCSFAFATVKDSWNDEDKNNVIRSLEKAKLYDVAIVTHPAYIKTSANYRTREDVYKDFVELREKEETRKQTEEKKKINYKTKTKKKDLQLVDNLVER